MGRHADTIASVERRADALRRLTGQARLEAAAELFADVYEKTGRLQAVCIEIRGLLGLRTPLP